jgi:signal transduction histidine kinase
MGISKKKAYLKSMKQNCYRLTRLINNILDVTKLDSGFITLQLQNIDIISYVENITMSVIPYAENKGIELIFDTYVEEKVVAVDPNKIERIILNLLSNALKFTDTGGKIYVSISNTEDSIIISVKDNGIGIPEDKLELIFERFMQVDKTLRRNHEGTGIGLSLVKSFVELHEGSIQIVSKINEGSEFLVNLPIRLVDNQLNTMEVEIEGDFIEKVNLELADIYGEVIKETK